MSEKEISIILSKIGLDETDVKIYFLCLSYWTLSTTTISRLLKIPRTTIYDRLEKLTQRGIFKTEKTTKWAKYSSATPREIIDVIYTENEKNIQTIKEIQSCEESWLQLVKNTSTLPKITFYEWDEVFKIINAKIKKSKSGDFIENIDSIIENTWWSLKKLTDEFYLWKHAKTREIAFESELARKYQKIMRKKGQVVKLLSAESSLSKLASDIFLVENYYYHITFGNVIQWVEIYNPIFYQTQKELFDYIRERL